ncbi:glycine betaine transporter OpuD [Geomicrobium sp. JCM 19055]|nr:glycine betaine transporter OpuD [Geomicrobium sp. JCM 19055]
MILALILLMFIATFGSTMFSLNLFTNTLGTYLQTLPELSFRIAPGSQMRGSGLMIGQSSIGRGGLRGLLMLGRLSPGFHGGVHYESLQLQS